ncbi:hypothetical protein QNJ25_02110 [Macrococcus caseolyticus]|uniref:DUF3885 domain-containing protein n=1 Tax=Macrococcoides caseolyticum TaxID=69966 RepID=UPI0024BC97D5|nr:hypothetical protein [Macrococcus caseolyticus]MDJ1152740.1 hypothetical protein [Macrococcus caseolyticus]
MDYYQFMSRDIIEQNSEFEHIELVKNQSRFIDSDKLNHAVFEQVRFEMENYFHVLFKDVEQIKIIFCVAYKDKYYRLNLIKYFKQFERFNFNLYHNELSDDCHQYVYIINKRNLNLQKLVKDICYQDFAYESQTFRKASILTIITNLDEDIFYYPYDDRGIVIYKK